MDEVYVGLDVSDKSTHLCVVDGAGAVIWSGACASDPQVIARTLKTRAPGVERVILETGPLSSDKSTHVCVVDRKLGHTLLFDL